MGSAGSGCRVLIVVHNLPVPLDRRVWLEATTLQRAGYVVSVICPTGSGYTALYERLEGVDIFRYPVPFGSGSKVSFVAEFVWGFLLTSVISTWVVVCGRGVDVLQVCNPPETYWPLGCIAKLFGRVFIFDHHDLSPEMYAAKFGSTRGFTMSALRLLERITFRTADIVIATNESHRAVAVERGRVPLARVYVVRSGPDLERLKRTTVDRSIACGREYALVYLGEICIQDGVDHLVRAVKILRDDLGRDDFHAVFVGGGPYQPAVRAYAQEIDVADVCTFTGRVSDADLCRILSSADIGVDPDPKTEWSDKSTMNKMMEYMAFGLPIVAYDLREHRVSAGEAAVYADASSERSLAEAIDVLLDNPTARRQMGGFGESRVRNALSWEHSAPNLLSAYEHAEALLRERLNSGWRRRVSRARTRSAREWSGLGSTVSRWLRS